MKIVIAPNSFKESLSAQKVALCIEKGVRKVFPKSDIMKNPLADGGTGTVKSIISAIGGTIIKEKVTGPLDEKVTAEYGISNDNRFAVIEMASAAGLALVPKEKRNPFYTTTYGVGELIKKALDRNVKKIFIGMGDSATNDGGAGLVQALGVKLLDKDKKELSFGGKELLRLKHIDVSGIDSRIKKTEFIALSDVKNPLIGKNGASYVFSPQKGATPLMVKILDRALTNYRNMIKRELKKEVNVPGAGAAGGLGAGLLAFLNAKIISGVETIIKLTNLENKIKDADLIITGEGKLDEQTALGKVPVGVSKLAKKYKIPVIAIVPWVDEKANILHKFNISAIISTATHPMTIEESKRRVKELVIRASEQVMRLIKIGNKIGDD